MHMKRQNGRSVLPRESLLAQGVRLALGALSVSAALGMLASGAQAQEQELARDGEPAPKKMQRVEITGSAIKRLESETALPVQVITRADIEKAGVTTAAELMARVSANEIGRAHV